MAKTGEIVRYLDDLLRRSEFHDYTANGLQVEGGDEVTQVGFAVDSCEQVFEALCDCQMIVVHHGLWWPSVERIVGLERKRLSVLLNHNINLYVSHLPLDHHPQVGNNAQILERLGYGIKGEFAEVGWYADLPEALPASQVAAEYSKILGTEVRSCLFGPEMVRRVGVCSGGGASRKILEQVQDMGIDMYLTGEGGHSMYHVAREMNLNVALGGHYQTEIFGVQALMPYLEEKFGVKTRFYDCPTGF